MKLPIRSLVVASALLAALGGGYRAWQAWRHARLDLVTLHVRNETLASVLRRMERQTWEPIALDSGLDARVTLDLEEVPLADALQQVAEQIGGLARATYAVFEKPPAVERLAALIRAGTPPESAGWTNLSGTAHHPGPDGGGAEVLVFPPGVPEALARGEKQVRVFRGGGDGHPEGSQQPALDVAAGPDAGKRVVEVVEDVVRGGPEPTAGGRVGTRAGGPAATRRIVVRAGGGTDEGGGEGRILEFDLSPERLLLETRLAAALGTGQANAGWIAPATSAPEVAARVRGQWARLFTLEKSPVPHLPGMRMVTRSLTGPPPGPGANPSEAAASEVRRGQYDRLQRLTPQQRARAGGHGAATDASR